MLDYLLYIAIVIMSIIIMEVVAILTHKYIMHGPGWFLHKSHHSKKRGFFELNDFYFIIFSIPSIYCILNGLKYNNNIILSIGIGILFYGLIYIFLHDIFVHRRFSIVKKVNSPYLKKVRKAHLKHHSAKTKKGCTNFGFITY